MHVFLVYVFRRCCTTAAEIDSFGKTEDIRVVYLLFKEKLVIDFTSDIVSSMYIPLDVKLYTQITP